MKISSAFPSKYLKASDLQDRNVTVTMSHVELEDVGDAERKPVLYFRDKQKGLVLNKTNARTIAAVYGDDTRQWETKPIVLFPAMVDFRGDSIEAVRVRIPQPPVAAPPPSTVRPQPERGFHESENPGDGLGDEANPPPLPRTKPYAADLNDEIPF
jgi:hypothetical protein